MRDNTIDIAKGILIILVVIGHSYSLSGKGHFELSRWEDYIYLFHMPAFFIISGLCYKKVNMETVKLDIIKKAKRLLLPYAFYVSCIGGGVASQS